jgi:Cupin superfamily protein
MCGLNIATMLAPRTLEDFFQSSYGKSFIRVGGGKGRFGKLLTWESLNSILQHQRLDYPRIRLSREGKNLPHENFIRYLSSRRGGPIPRLNVPALLKELRGGATLILDAVDEISEPVAELAESFEHGLHESVQVNMYAGWGETNGFDLHWDDHDVFIVQVSGKKNWKVYPPTRQYPLFRDVEFSTEPPSQAVWEGIVEDGDVLYIPRGWWHIAIPVNEPTIHLTFGVNKRNGLDMLGWLSDQLRSSQIFRMDLPRFESESEQAKHLAVMKNELLRIWDDEILKRYFDDQDSNAQGRPHISLPWAVMSDILPSEDDFIVKLTIPRDAILRNGQSHGTIELIANAKRWTFAKSAEPILNFLNESRTCTVSQLYHAASPHLDMNTLRTFLGELLLEGIIAITRLDPLPTE